MDFRDRAHFEADRYGADPWIFVRELLQNARDAGARSVRIETEEREGLVRLTCRDDGAGMTAEHAKRFLFKLYASSKEHETGAAGRFGVGFWSILRFEPKHIVIRSWPQGAAPWEISLTGSLEHGTSGVPTPGPHGTEIVLTRAALPEVSRHIREAAQRHARFLRTRGKVSAPLDVTVDGEAVVEELNLPAPSATFQRRGVRGVVALGSAPLVELFSKGLHVRSAKSVDELLATPDPKAARANDALVEGLAPQVILDGDRLDLVRSRSDARDDKALRRAVALAERELARLIEKQLAFSRPVPLWRRALRPAFAVAAVATLALGFGWLLTAFVHARPQPQAIRVAPPPRPAGFPPGPAAYRDPSLTYRGPQTDALPQKGKRTSLTYEPRDLQLYFAGLHLKDPDAPARLRREELQALYPQRLCRAGCVQVRVIMDVTPGWVRLPVPTGHVLDAATVSWDGSWRQVFRSPEGEPLVLAPGYDRVIVTYRTGPGKDAASPVPTRRPLPEDAPAFAFRSADLSAAALSAWVARRIAYSNDPSLGAQLRAQDATGALDFMNRVLRTGAGDCDVQNGLLAQLLERSGVPARLAIGYVGHNGRADPTMHAWVEYRDLDGTGPWKLADATVYAEPPVVAARMAEPAESEPVAMLGGGYSSDDTASRAPGLAYRSSRDGRVEVTLPRAPLGLLALAPLLGLAFLVMRPRVRRQVQLDQDHDVSLLLQGALTRPEAFNQVPALFHQPLVPRRGRQPVSLATTFELARAERLYTSDVGSPFADKAVSAGAVVINAFRPEGKVVADALGAVNLDRWDRLLRATEVPALLERANAYLASRSEPWTLMVSAQITSEPAVLVVPGTRENRWVLVNADAQWLKDAIAMSADRPQRALFQVLDELAICLRVPAARRARLLAPLAAAALHEEDAAK